MKQKSSTTLAPLGLFSLVGLAAPEQPEAKDHRRNNQNSDWAELGRDRAELRRDQAELERDRADLRRLYRSRASRAEIEQNRHYRYEIVSRVFIDITEVLGDDAAKYGAADLNGFVPTFLTVSVSCLSAARLYGES